MMNSQFDKKYNQLIEQDWKSKLAGGLVAGTMLLGANSNGANHKYPTFDQFLKNQQLTNQQQVTERNPNIPTVDQYMKEYQKYLQSKQKKKQVQTSSKSTPKPNKSLPVINISKQQVSNYCLPLIKRFQGSIKVNGKHVTYDDLNSKFVWDRSKLTWDQFVKKCKGKPTIGYGETNLDIVKKGKITDQQADQLLLKRINDIYDKLQKQLKGDFIKLNIYQKAALISLYYNFGTDLTKTPKLIKYIKQGKYYLASQQFLDCNKVTINGKKVPLKGLTKRRQQESQLFLKKV